MKGGGVVPPLYFKNDRTNLCENANVMSIKSCDIGGVRSTRLRNHNLFDIFTGKISNSRSKTDLFSYFPPTRNITLIIKTCGNITKY